MSQSESIEELPADVSSLEGWRPARHRASLAVASLPSRRVTIRLDEDILAVFKGEALAGGLPYQVAINQALRAYLRERELSREKRSVEIVLAALEDETVREKLRGIL
jgi:uncharacterized protein (DUF4415 family)